VTAGGTVCDLTARAPAGTVAGSTVEVTKETYVGDVRGTESPPCGAVDAAGEVRCTITLKGRNLEGGQTTFTFTLAGGQTSTITRLWNCATPKALGERCN
jgi:hypothetical protein